MDLGGLNGTYVNRDRVDTVALSRAMRSRSASTGSITSLVRVGRRVSAECGGSAVDYRRGAHNPSERVPLTLMSQFRRSVSLKPKA